MGKTFFAHFCAGETAEEVGGRVAALRSLGIGGILDYAAEVDLRPAKEREEREAKRRAAGDDRLLREVSLSRLLDICVYIYLMFLYFFFIGSH